MSARGSRTAGTKGRRAAGRSRPAAERVARGALERLWAPWRMAYIGRAHEPAECLFCRAARTRADRAFLVLARRPHALLLLNRYPYNPGHLMVAVARHVGAFHELTAAERDGLLELTGLAERALAAEYGPHGLNVGVNLGRVAGAGVLGHLHLHVVPRWDGDTNFMPVVGGTRVLPESLTRTWSRLRAALGALEAGARPRRARGGIRGTGR